MIHVDGEVWHSQRSNPARAFLWQVELGHDPPAWACLCLLQDVCSNAWQAIRPTAAEGDALLPILKLNTGQQQLPGIGKDTKFSESNYKQERLVAVQLAQ